MGWYVFFLHCNKLQVLQKRSKHNRRCQLIRGPHSVNVSSLYHITLMWGQAHPGHNSKVPFSCANVPIPVFPDRFLYNLPHKFAALCGYLTTILAMRRWTWFIWCVVDWVILTAPLLRWEEASSLPCCCHHSHSSLYAALSTFTAMLPSSQPINGCISSGKPAFPQGLYTMDWALSSASSSFAMESDHYTASCCSWLWW